ncbi:hypothetical protein LOD99_15809 [Oopsacas minuta]|uniref:Uncharacterized protein n=1 Tax=Oopsacas minuta TaxID=111878 RepID=A0AAV7KAM5_9METZ|nr:hypothetical protein LOD99_15809 [Oopsacas minuta]
MASKSVPEDVTIFQQARDTIDTDVNEIIECLNNKRKQLFEEITNLENEYTRKQQQTQKELQKLQTLISQTEELGENNLLKLQRKVVAEIQEEIENLSLESEQNPNYNIKVKWEYSKRSVFLIVGNYTIEKVYRDKQSTEPWSTSSIDGQEVTVVVGSGEGKDADLKVREGGSTVSKEEVVVDTRNSEVKEKIREIPKVKVGKEDSYSAHIPKGESWHDGRTNYRSDWSHIGRYSDRNYQDYENWEWDASDKHNQAEFNNVLGGEFRQGGFDRGDFGQNKREDMTDWEEEIASPINVTIFQQARDTIEQDISKIIQSLNDKKAVMFEEIDRLEQEYAHKQEKFLTNLNTLDSLKMRTEEELGDNILAKVQKKVIKDLQEGINLMNLEIENSPDYEIKIRWRMNVDKLLQNISISSIEVKMANVQQVQAAQLPVYVADTFRSTKNNKTFGSRHEFPHIDWDDEW